MYQPSFSFIIAYRHSADRILNLRRVLDWVNGFSGSEVIIVEQDSHSKISHINLKAKHIFTKSKGQFNKSWAFNVGLKYSSSNIVIFGDSDLIMNPDDFIKGLQMVENFDMVNPYKSVIDLTPAENNLPFEQIVNINRAGRGETDIQKVPLCGGICIFRRDAIEKILGWSEEFQGWGGEDDFQSLKVKHFLNWTELNAKCYHFYHQKVQPDMTFYQKNLSFLQNSAKMSKDEFWQLVQTTSQKNGLKNKYENI